MGLHDYCHASVRYSGMGALRHKSQDVEVTREWLDDKRLLVKQHTPVGDLREIYHYDEWNQSAFNTEFRLKTPEDIKIMEWMLQHEEWSWDQSAIDKAAAEVGDRGAPQFYFRRSPLQGLFIEHMGFEPAVMMLYDQPEVIEHYMAVAAEADDAMYDVLCASPLEIFNFGENIDAHMDPPTLWRKYLAPYYKKRTEQLHRAGKKVHIHIDGAMKPLLNVIRDVPFDGIEAATPLPQGDVTLEQIKYALGDMILLDGIPAIYFLPTFDEPTLLDCVKRIVDLFYPRLVLGISDEIPPDGDIERVRKVGELAQTLI
ncbi:MAG: uroporphyrinogen decarboxylase family protein [Anaerolineae bacterium]